MFLRKNLLYGYREHWFKFPDLDKINHGSTKLNFSEGYFTRIRGFPRLKLDFHALFSRRFASKQERFFFVKLLLQRLFKTQATRTLCFRFNLRLVILRVKSLNFDIFVGFEQVKLTFLIIWLIACENISQIGKKFVPVSASSQTWSKMERFSRHLPRNWVKILLGFSCEMRCEKFTNMEIANLHSLSWNTSPSLFEPMPFSAYKCSRIQRLKLSIIPNLDISLIITALFALANQIMKFSRYSLIFSSRTRHCGVKLGPICEV